MGKKADVRFIDYLERRFGLSKEQRDILHEQITRKGLSKSDIIELAKAIKRQFPNK